MANKVMSAELAELSGARIVEGELGVPMTAYSAIVACIARTGGYTERGFATDQIGGLQVQIAKSRAGEKWAELDDTARTNAINRAYATAKRYAEKGTGICKSPKGLKLGEVMGADSIDAAINIVRDYFVANDLYTQELLFAHFDFAVNKAKPKAKPGVPLDADGNPVSVAPDAGTDNAPDAGTDNAPDAGTDNAPDAGTDNAPDANADAGTGNAPDAGTGNAPAPAPVVELNTAESLCAHVASAFANLSPEEAQKFADAMIMTMADFASVDAFKLIRAERAELMRAHMPKMPRKAKETANA